VSRFRYFQSGKELMNMARVYEKEGHVEDAYVLYLKYTMYVLQVRKPHCLQSCSSPSLLPSLFIEKSPSFTRLRCVQLRFTKPDHVFNDFVLKGWNRIRQACVKYWLDLRTTNVTEDSELKVEGVTNESCFCWSGRLTAIYIILYTVSQAYFALHGTLHKVQNF
jgi:hypothetical protein